MIGVVLITLRVMYLFTQGGRGRTERAPRTSTSWGLASLDPSHPTLHVSHPIVCWLLIAAFVIAAEPEKPKEPVPPKVLLTSPLAIVPGTKARIAFRGAGLDEPKEVRSSHKELKLKIASKGKIVVPQEFTAERVGDTQTEVDLELPKDLPPGEIEFEIETAGGVAKRKLLVLAADKAAWDEGSNNGFREAKVIESGRTVIGLINEARDVDVYRVELKAGATLVGAVQTSKSGSPLDAAVTLYDADGRLLASFDDSSTGDSSNDDASTGDDPAFRHTATSAGPIFVAVIDANDRGGSTHAYLLTLDVTKK